MKTFIVIALLAIFSFALIGCDSKQTSESGSTSSPTFTLAISEYPSWSVFGVAKDCGLVDQVSKKYGIKINIKLLDYDSCITAYGSSTTDAVCITNMDALSPSIGRQSVAIMPTSTSAGADAMIVGNDINDFSAMKGKLTYGLEKSVSQYAFERTLQVKGLNPDDYPFRNMDPALAATAFQTKQKDIDAIMVWNPFVLNTLRTRSDAKILLDSTSIPEEIIDMVVVGKDVLAKPSGEKFAKAVTEIYYRFNQQLADSKDDSLYVALGAKFSNLSASDMKKCCQQTRFYSTASAATTLYESKTFREKTMPQVVDFCVSHGIVPKKTVIGFEDDSAQLNFTTKYLK